MSRNWYWYDIFDPLVWAHRRRRARRSRSARWPCTWRRSATPRSRSARLPTFFFCAYFAIGLVAPVSGSNSLVPSRTRSTIRGPTRQWLLDSLTGLCASHLSLVCQRGSNRPACAREPKRAGGCVAQINRCDGHANSKKVETNAAILSTSWHWIIQVPSDENT